MPSSVTSLRYFLLKDLIARTESRLSSRSVELSIRLANFRIMAAPSSGVCAPAPPPPNNHVDIFLE